VALFFCRRRIKEPPKRRSPRFTIGEIEPFFTVEYRDCVPASPAVAVTIGVAIRKTDGTWGMHELADETDLRRYLRAQTSPEIGERQRTKAVLETKGRLVEALNRLREHYERIYVYQTAFLR
jgi:hypothetical protein